MVYQIDPTPAQFRWLADQLRATRALIAYSHKVASGSETVFGIKLGQLRSACDGAAANLCGQVNTGMSGFPLTALLESKWQQQFQYRDPTPKGVRQYPDGALYLPPLPHAECKLLCVDMPVLDEWPITSLIFRLDLTDRANPRWFVEPHQNTRPSRAGKNKPWRRQ